MLILGAQILLGFALRSPFEDAFEALSPEQRTMAAAALMLIVVTVTLLITPGTFHRLAEDGNDTGRLLSMVTRVADIALLPLGAAIGLSVLIGCERIFGRGAGIAAGALFTALTLGLWYGVGYFRRTQTGQRERANAARLIAVVQKTPLHDRIDQMLTEARVILPGAQALLGFQLAIVLTKAFDSLPASSKALHGISLGFIALAVILLIAPAAYHRIVCAGEDKEEIHKVGTWFITAATVPLALGMAGDVHVVIAKIADSHAIGAAAAGASLVMLVLLWHVLPLVLRARR
jgi:hypothetical protein